MGTANTPAASWYPDPADATRLRYWDGSRWTEHTAPAQARQPVPQARSVTEREAQLPAAGTNAGAASPGFPEPPSRSRGGLFGSKKALESELEELRRTVDDFGYAEREALQNEIARLRSERDQMTLAARSMRTECAQIEAQLVRTRDEVILQEVGVYDYHHRLDDTVAYKARIDAIRAHPRNVQARRRRGRRHDDVAGERLGHPGPQDGQRDLQAAASRLQR